MKVLGGPRAGDWKNPRGILYGPIGEQLEGGRSVQAAPYVAALAPASTAIEEVPAAVPGNQAPVVAGEPIPRPESVIPEQQAMPVGLSAYGAANPTVITQR
jgi:hypothetical protein